MSWLCLIGHASEEGGEGNSHFLPVIHPFPWAQNWLLPLANRQGYGEETSSCYCGLVGHCDVWTDSHTRLSCSNPWQKPKCVLNFKNAVPTDLRLQNRLQSFAQCFTQLIILPLTCVRCLHSGWFARTFRCTSLVRAVLNELSKLVLKVFVVQTKAQALERNTLLGAAEVSITYCQWTWSTTLRGSWAGSSSDLLMPLTYSKARALRRGISQSHEWHKDKLNPSDYIAVIPKLGQPLLHNQVLVNISSWTANQ